jgi:hypothetical protein
MYRITVFRRMSKVTGRPYWFWRLQAGGNYRTLAHSEEYTRRRAAMATATQLADALGVRVDYVVE